MVKAGRGAVLRERVTRLRGREPIDLTRLLEDEHGMQSRCSSAGGNSLHIGSGPAASAERSTRRGERHLAMLHPAGAREPFGKGLDLPPGPAQHQDLQAAAAVQVHVQR